MAASASSRLIFCGAATTDCNRTRSPASSFSKRSAHRFLQKSLVSIMVTRTMIPIPIPTPMSTAKSKS
jgi:hypothetical protein